MDGLYYFDDIEDITLFWFYPDGRVVSMFKSTKFDQPLRTYPWFKVDSDVIHFSRGIYTIDIWDAIIITVRGCFGKIVYDGYIRDDDTIDLYYRCPITNFKKLVTYVRFCEEQHIIHLELDLSILN